MKQVFKRIFQCLGILLLSIVLAGLTFRAFGPKSHQPPGKLVNIDGINLHIHATGKKSKRPTVVIENGASASTDYYHWLSTGLKDSLRVVRYDRAGNGYSESSSAKRGAENIAEELHQLLEKSGESPPYLLVGHSIGGPYIRVFAQLYPDEVDALVFIDATHPEQVKRLNAASESSFRFKTTLFLLGASAWLADLGVLALYESFTEPLLAGDGLPTEINVRTKDFLLNGKRTRAYKKEIESYHSVLERAAAANEFGTLPIRVFTAVEIDRAAYLENGIDPDEFLNEAISAQKEFTKLSVNGEQFLIDGSHQTIFTKKENADVINREILKLSIVH